MIYITGDTHGEYDFDRLASFVNETPNLNKNDYLIIAGDFGAVWKESTLSKDLLPYKSLPLTVLFVDGNHENFDLLNRYPIEIWKGGKIHKIDDSIIHLMRGQIFNIDNKVFFTFGGATSIDKIYRRKNVTWWEEERPSLNDFNEAINNLKKVNNKVDYIITHTCDERALYYYPLKNKNDFFDSFPENKMLSYFEENVKYKHWYFGHYHMDGKLTNKKTVLYYDIIKI